MKSQLVNFDYHVDGDGPNQKVWFSFETFPMIKFAFSDVTIGDSNDDGTTQIRYTLETSIISEDVTEDDILSNRDFNEQVRGLLSHLLESMVKASKESSLLKPKEPIDNQENLKSLENM